MDAPSIKTTPAMPIDPAISSYTRFVGAFEPSEYESGWIEESLSAKTSCFIGDLSPLLKIRIRGPEALDFLKFLSTNSWENARPGKTKYVIMCEDEGYIIGEGLCLMLAQDDFVMTGVIHAPWTAFQLTQGRRKFNATVDFETDEWFIFQVQGPKSVPLLSELTNNSIQGMKYTDDLQINIEGHTVYCLRQGVTGEIGFEIWGNISASHEVYKSICSIGKKHGLRRLGGRCKIVNQTEAGFTIPTVDFVPAILGRNHELATYRENLEAMAPGMVGMLTAVSGSYTSNPEMLRCSPYDLNLDTLVKFDHEFIGRRALEQLALKPARKLVTLSWDADDVFQIFGSLMGAGETYEFMEMPKAALGTVIASTVLSMNGSAIGFATSRCYSPFFKEMISLAVIQTEHAIGETVVVVWGTAGYPQKHIHAVRLHVR